MKCKIKNLPAGKAGAKCKMWNHNKSGIFNFKFYILHSNGGFTFLELLVSIGIFVVITTTVVFNFRAGERSDALRLAAEDLVSKVREVQVMGQTGQRVEMCIPGDVSSSNDPLAFKVCARGVDCGTLLCTAQVPQGGYGVHIANGTIIGFADGNNTHRYELGEEMTTPVIRFPHDVSIDQITPQDVETGALDVVFFPPTPITIINGQESDAMAEIVLRHAQSDQRKTVTIRRISGRIEVE